MSAEVLRRAAVGIRAQVERLSTDTAVWDEQFPATRIYADPSTYGRLMVHPAAALAVADWLDTAGADLWAHGPLCDCGSGCHECDDSLWQPHARRALAVARAYLGEQPC